MLLYRDSESTRLETRDFVDCWYLFNNRSVNAGNATQLLKTRNAIVGDPYHRMTGNEGLGRGCRS